MITEIGWNVSLPARVVAVMVRVDEVPDRLVGERADLLDDARRHVLVLRVHHQHRLRPHQDADVAAAPVERVDAAAQRLQREALVRLAVVMVRRRRRCRRRRLLVSAHRCGGEEQGGDGQPQRHDSTSGERIT
jgi:hypothetical protein